jgi:hypothetical protein
MTNSKDEPLTPEQQAILDKIPVIHRSPSYPPGCKHEWVYRGELEEQEGYEPSHCEKCGMSWTRYIFTECP